MNYKALVRGIKDSAEVVGPWNGDTGFYDYLTESLGKDEAAKLLRDGEHSGVEDVMDEDTEEVYTVAWSNTIQDYWDSYQNKLWLRSELEDLEKPKYEEDVDNSIDEDDSEDYIVRLSRRLQQLYSDMENDPEVLAEHGNGGEATDRYGVEMDEIESEIRRLRGK